MKRTGNMKYGGRPLFLMIGIAVMGCLSTMLWSAQASAIYVPITPNDTNMLKTSASGAPSNGPVGGNIYHILKKEASSTVTKVEVEAYFNNPSPARRIVIASRTLSGCETFGNVAPFITVRLSTRLTNGTTQSVTYSVPRANICAGTTVSTNPYGSANSRFFASYPVPSNFTAALAQRDLDTNLYKINVDINYNPAVPQGGAAGQEQFILFRVETDKCAAGTCDRYISATPAYDGANNIQRNISTLGRGEQTYVNQRFPFGLPCSETTPSLKRLAVYDLDNAGGVPAWDTPEDGTGRARFYIEYSRNNGATWTTFTGVQYGSVTSGFREIHNGRVMIRPIDGSLRTTEILFTMEPRVRYRVVVGAIWTGNLIGLGLPTETIFGDIDCAADLNANIVTNPAASPLEVGQTVTMTGQAIRSGTSQFTSNYNHTWRVWYDTGNGAFNAGETLACPVSSGPHLNHAGNTTLNVASCPNIPVDSSKSGGQATAICAQLILTATDAFTQVNVGAPPNGLIRCVQMGKYPHMEVRNGDLLAGGVFKSTSPSCLLSTSPVISSSQRRIPAGGTYYTSHATYGVTGLGLVNKFGSQGVSYGQPTSDFLVFANQGAVADGYFYNANGSTALPTQPRCLNDPFSIFAPSATATSGSTNVNVSGLGGNVRLTAPGTIQLSASTPLPPGRKLVIYAPNANVVINSNITYADVPYASLNTIPQVIILTNRNITIKDSVTQIDGLLAARGDISTCDLAPRLKVCTQPLAVNGAVVAGGDLIALRTAGAQQPDYGAMAEVFNLRPDMLISQLPEAGATNVFVRTVSETEVPPRF